MTTDRDLTAIPAVTKAAAETLAVSLIRQARPEADVRVGTAVRDLVVTPGSILLAHSDQQVAAALDRNTLSGAATDSESAERLLGNFLFDVPRGTKATGTVILELSDDRPFFIAETTTLITSTGIRVVASAAGYARVSGGDYDIKRSETGYYVFVPCRAAVAGIASNIENGTALRPTGSITPALVRVTAVTNFSGGTDDALVGDMLARLPQTLALRSLDSGNAIRGTLITSFPQIDQVSVVGTRDPECLRARIGRVTPRAGVVDALIKPARQAPLVVNLTAVRQQEPGSYKVDVPAAIVPGQQMIRSVGALPSASGLSFTATPYIAHGVVEHVLDEHSFLGSYRCSHVVELRDVPPDDDGVYPATMPVSVELYAAPVVTAAQAYVDRQDVAPVGQDLLIRAAHLARVFVKATVSTTEDFDAAKAVAALVSAVNAKQFMVPLSESEVMSTLHANGVKLVRSLKLQAMTSYGTTLGGSILVFSDKEVGASGKTSYFHLDPRDVTLLVVN